MLPQNKAIDGFLLRIKLAKRLGIAGSTLHKSEQSEADDRITLGDVVQARARAIAMEEVKGVAHTMGLEDQRPGAELLRGRWSDLWR